MNSQLTKPLIFVAKEDAGAVRKLSNRLGRKELPLCCCNVGYGIVMTNIRATQANRLILHRHFTLTFAYMYIKICKLTEKLEFP